MATRGVASVPSPVTNLCEYNEQITTRQFSEAVVHAFKAHFGSKQPVSNYSDDVPIYPHTTSSALSSVF